MPAEGPLITTIIPTYRRPALLARAINSVLDQKYDRVRVCVYDNASGDSTAEVVARLARDDQRIHYYCRPVNVGPVENFNLALKQLETPLFSLLSDDDVLLPGFYQAGVAMLDAHPKAAFFCGRTAIFDQVEDVVRPSGPAWPEGYYEPSTETVLRMIQAHFPWTGVLWRCEVAETVGQLDPFGSDDNYIVKAATLHPFVVSSEFTGVLFVHSEGLTGGLLVDGATASDEEPSRYLQHLVGRPYQLQADLLSNESLPLDVRIAAVRALSRELAKDLLAYYLFMSVPAKRLTEMETVRLALDGLGLPLGWRTVIAATHWIARHGGPAANTQARVSRALDVRRKRSRNRAWRTSPLDRQVRNHIQEIEGHDGREMTDVLAQSQIGMKSCA